MRKHEDAMSTALRLEVKAKDRIQQGMFGSAASFAMDAYRQFNKAGMMERGLKMFDLAIECDKKYRGLA